MLEFFFLKIYGSMNFDSYKKLTFLNLEPEIFFTHQINKKAFKLTLPEDQELTFI